MQTSFDVVVIGAGAAGLMAAREVALTGRRVAVIEAKERCGGRMHTITNPHNQPIELGAEFVHGKLPITLDLLKNAGVKTYTIGGVVWRKEGDELQKAEMAGNSPTVVKKMQGLKKDISLQDFVDKHLEGEKEEVRKNLLQYAKGYYAADPMQLSTTAMCEELTKSEEKQFRPEGGYQGLVSYLETQCRESGVAFFLAAPVETIEWAKNKVAIKTTNQIIEGAKAIITVSLGILQSGCINFSPALPEKMAAARKLGYGHVQKLVLHFADAFWKKKTYTQGKNLQKLGFLFSEAPVPTWWTHHPKNDAVLTGWLAGPDADQLMDSTTLTAQGLDSLRQIFSIGLPELNGLLLSAHHHNWSADAHFRGAYSYAVVNGEQSINELSEPEEQTLFFAGEGLYIGKEFGTVEAALHNGRETAQRLIAAFPKK